MIEIEVQEKERKDGKETEEDNPKESTCESLESFSFCICVVCSVVHDNDASLKLTTEANISSQEKHLSYLICFFCDSYIKYFLF
jgi:hypothetical protein